MKNTLLTLLASLLFLSGFCGEPKYEVHAKDTRPLTKETISKAKTLADLIPGYPEHWISSYVSVEISASRDGKLQKATGINEALTAEQKNILNTVDVGIIVVVDVNYKYNDLSTLKGEDRQIHVSMTIVPETEAEYIGGREELNKYLKKNVLDKISIKAPLKLHGGTVIFTVNEEGDIVNAKLSESSGDPKTDKLFVEGINKMPKWKPAQNSKAVKVKQDFIFSLGVGGC